MRLLILAFALLVGSMSTTAWSQHREDLQPGDVGYQHQKYHWPYKRFWLEINTGYVGPGDDGYLKERFQGTYKELYKSGKCACQAGFCRPTLWRPTELQAESGYDVMVNRQWVPVPQAALHNEKSISPALWQELMAEASAHVCAYTNPLMPFEVDMECAILPVTIG